MGNEQELPKRSKACALCRARKVKCVGVSPCDNCFGHGTECVYLESRRGKRKRTRGQSAVLEDRFTPMGALCRAQNDVPVTDHNQAQYDCQGGRSVAVQVLQFQSLDPRVEHSSNVWLDNGNSESTGASEELSAPRRSFDVPRNTLVSSHPNQQIPAAQQQSRSPTSDIESLTEALYDLSEQIEPSNLDKEGSVLAPQNVNWEHHGPGSWFSICSKPGVSWVNQATGATHFAETARVLTATWTGRLKIDRSGLITKIMEPDRDMAWKYCAAYFEESIEAAFGIVYRPDFETSLRTLFQDGHAAEDNAARYALRQTVYAAGCRIYHSGNPSKSFHDIHTESWAYFQGALSVLGELLFTPTGSLAVRALAAMTYYAEGLGSPALEYMLCANAVRLAQAKGLHRQPAKAWNLAQDDVLHYNWLFWAIYCCDKQIAQRSGRPSAIDDDDISCQIPTSICPGSTINIQAFTAVINHARISSRISKTLLSVKAFQQPPNTVLETALNLHEQLQRWRSSLPAAMQPGDHVRSFQVSPYARLLPNLLIHYSYYGSLMAIHTIFAYPWISATVFGHERSGLRIKDQIETSSKTIASAAANTIVIARSLETNSASTLWSAIYYPMIGLINLFIYVLHYPTAPSTRSDISLLDVAAGYFGHMDFVTAGELSFPFARDVAALARQAVQKAEMASAVALRTSATAAAKPLVEPEDLARNVFVHTHDFDLDDWGIFSSVFVDENPTANPTIHPEHTIPSEGNFFP